MKVEGVVAGSVEKEDNQLLLQIDRSSTRSSSSTKACQNLAKVLLERTTTTERERERARVHAKTELSLEEEIRRAEYTTLCQDGRTTLRVVLRAKEFHILSPPPCIASLARRRLWGEPPAHEKLPPSTVCQWMTSIKINSPSLSLQKYADKGNSRPSYVRMFMYVRGARWVGRCGLATRCVTD